MGFGPRLSRMPRLIVLVPLLVAACAGGPRPTFTFPVGPQATQAPATPTPAPSAAPSTSASATASTSAGASASASPSPSPTPTPSPTATPSPTPSPTPTPTPSPSPSETPTPVPTASPSRSASPLPGQPGFVPGTSASPRQIAIEETDAGTFTPNVVTLAEGETVAFVVTNTGTKEHAFTIGGEGDVFATPTTARATAKLDPGETATIPFEVTGVGPFVFASTSEGDVAAGQVGYTIVVGPDAPTVGTEAKPRLVGVVATGTGFEQMSLTVAKGETVTFLVSNAGSGAREFIVGPFDKVNFAQIDQITTVTTGPINPGQVKPLTYTFPATGTFGYATHVPGAPQVEPPGSIDLR